MFLGFFFASGKEEGVETDEDGDEEEEEEEEEEAEDDAVGEGEGEGERGGALADEEDEEDVISMMRRFLFTLLGCPNLCTIIFLTALIR